MDPVSALIAFSLAAGLLTVTPGLDTALVLRTAAVDGPGAAMGAGIGVCCGVMAWGLVAALGLGALLAVSELAFRALQIAGAAYLIWLGLGMLRSAVRPRAAGLAVPAVPVRSPGRTERARWLVRGLLTNLLNPKVGVFYVSFLPQFIPLGADVVGFSVLLAAIHAAMGVLWFGLLVLATRPFARALGRPAVTRSLDATTGTVLVAFGVRLALDRRIG